ncbi:nuclear transcription factor Y subunit B-1-like [Juglans microcarpa x Juglans regia]|uniref:nuclear transcription factor Y subunit B-1-like n=1 Tax=Juglans microcarpa x Juglans regia TaxID=2249226 RepID=UPI001B7D967C|nr:nuclear transcription factor Y subunit B-1-like [Juglans microcarpa x Juglans regia]
MDKVSTPTRDTRTGGLAPGVRGLIPRVNPTLTHARVKCRKGVPQPQRVKVAPQDLAGSTMNKGRRIMTPSSPVRHPTSSRGRSDDLRWALTTLDFEDYVEPLKVYLQREGGFGRGKAELQRRGRGRGGTDDVGEAEFAKEQEGGVGLQMKVNR